MTDVVESKRVKKFRAEIVKAIPRAVISRSDILKCILQIWAEDAVPATMHFTVRIRRFLFQHVDAFHENTYVNSFCYQASYMVSA